MQSTLLAAAVLGLALAGGTRAGSQDDEPQVYAQTPTRGSVRVAYFGKTGAPQIEIDYGTPPWKDEYQKAIESKKYVGQRWRLGQDFWTNLDSSFDFKLNGVLVKAGYYYLTLEMK